MRSKRSGLYIGMILGGIGYLLVSHFSKMGKVPMTETTLGAYYEALEAKKVQSLDLISKNGAGIELQWTEEDGTKKRVPHISDSLEGTIIAESRDAGVRNIKTTFRGEEFGAVLVGLLPALLFIFILLWIVQRQSGGSGLNPFQLGKGRARLLKKESLKTTFADVAGCDEAKYELQEIIEILKDPAKFTRLGGRIPKGTLLVGPPGTGKTLLAKAVAGEASIDFYAISGSDFVEMFVGVGAARVRNLFKGAKAPCIIFIDELDAVGRHRGAGLGGGHDEREQTLNQLLVEMDGIEEKRGMILIAATNRPDVLDPALLRPGRFDRQVVVDLPDRKGREAILSVHARGKPISKDVSLAKFAKQTPGCSGADLANILNEAVLLVGRHDRTEITEDDIDRSIEKVTMGLERKSMVLTPNEIQIVSYHEAGHALVAELLPNADPPQRATIIPRGRALGYVQSLPDEERHLVSKAQLLDRIVVLFAGRAAEELLSGPDKVTSGAESDFHQATEIIKKMVTQLGMSETIGPLSLGKQRGPVFLGRDIAERGDYGEDQAREIDTEIKRIAREGYDQAKKILMENRERLDALAKALRENETLYREEIMKITESTRSFHNTTPQ